MKDELFVYDGQMPVCEQAYKDGVLQATRVNFLGARGIEAVLTIDHTRGNQVDLSWLLYDGYGNWVRTLSPDYTLSGFQWRGVWGEVQGSLGTGRGYCANLGHPEDETGLVYMRARYYEPATGRFISEDPARDGVNWYLYASGYMHLVTLQIGWIPQVIMTRFELLRLELPTGFGCLV